MIRLRHINKWQADYVAFVSLSISYKIRDAIIAEMA